MKKILFIIIILMMTNLQANNYLSIARNQNITECDNLINKNFAYFNFLEDDDFHLDSNFTSSADGKMKNVRYYFNYSYDTPTIGDLSIINTPKTCISHLNISFIEDNVSCDQIKRTGNWRDTNKRGNINWVSNGSNNALFQSFNNNKGCQISYFITDIEFLP